VQTHVWTGGFQILRSQNRFEIRKNEMLEIHRAQLHVEKVVLIIIQPSMLKNHDDIGMCIVVAEFFHDSDFVCNCSIDFSFGSGGHPNQFSSKILFEIS
jgi:hypothetical protein